MPLGESSRAITLEFRSKTDDVKRGVGETKSLVKQFASETERDDAASHRRMSAEQLRQLRRSHAEHLREHRQAARHAADEYEKNLGAGFFSRLAHAATKSFRDGFKVGGESFGGGGLISGALSVATGNILTSVLGGVTSQITGGIKAGFDFNKLKEQTLLGFEIKLKGKKEAEDFFNQVAQFAEETPLELDQALSSVQRLMVAFTAPEALRSMRAITDEVSKQGKAGGEAQEAINGIGLQLQQMLLKGKVQQEELVSLAERQVDVYSYLTKELSRQDANFAKLDAEAQKQRLAELVQKNMIDARAAVATIVKGMEEDAGGTAARIAKETAEGMESNIKDSLTRTAGIASESAFKEYKLFLERSLNLLNTGAGERIAGGISATTGGLFAGFEKTLAAVSSGNLGQLGLDAVSSAAEGVKSGAQKLYDAGAGAAGQVEKGWRDRLDQHSPSLVMESLGFQAGQSLLFGFLKGAQSKEVLDRIERAIREAAERFKLDPDLIRAVIKKESDFNPRAVSSAGAEGLMQLMPGTAARFNVKDPFNIEQNIMGGSKYLRELLDLFGQRIDIALAAYNSGENRREYGRAARENRPIDYSVMPRGVQTQTEPYVNAVMRFFTRLQTGVDTFETLTQGRGASASQTQRGGRTADESRELAELTKARDEINAETLDHLEVLQLEQQRLGRWFAALTKEMGTGPMSEAASSDIIKRKAELEAAMEKNAKEFESYWLSQLQVLNSLDEKINALKGRALDTSAQDGGSFRPGSFLNLTDEQVRHVQGLAQGAIDKARQGAINVNRETATLAQTVTPQALAGVRLAAEEVGDTFKDLPPLIRASTKEAEKDTAELARAVSGMFGGLVNSTLRGQWREGLKGLKDDFLSWTVSLFQDWVESKIFKALSPKGIAGGGSSGGSPLGSLWGGIKSLFGFGGGSGGGVNVGGFDIGGAVSGARSGGISGLFSGLLGISAGGASAGAAGSASASMLAGLLGGGGALGASLGGLLGGGASAGGIGAAAGSSLAGGGGLAGSLGALFTNPWTAVVGGGILAGVALWKHFSHRTEKDLRKAIQQARGVDVKEMGVLQQIKQMGEQAFGRGQVRAHLAETINLAPVQELIDSYAASTGQGTRPQLPHEFLYNEAGGPSSSPITVNGSALMSSPFGGGLNPARASDGAGGTVFERVARTLEDLKRQHAQDSVTVAAALYQNAQAVGRFNTLSPGVLVAEGAHDARAEIAVAFLSESGSNDDVNDRLARNMRVV